MSSNFLQRFKGKTQTISKDGVHNILGGSSNNVPNANSANNPYIYTHSNGLKHQNQTSTQYQNTNSFKNTSQSINKKSTSQNKMSKTNAYQNDPKMPPQNRQKQSLKKSSEPEQKNNAPENPFLISNPFYLDEQQKARQQQLQRQLLKLQKIEAQKKKNQQKQSLASDPKKGTYSSSMNVRNASQTKKSQKQWAKLGGLGPNIGGQEWEEKKKKLQKMQDFANQVKAINLQKGPPLPKNTNKIQQKKDDPRSKALEYSKKVPKPVVKMYQKQEKQQEQHATKSQDVNQLSELQIYQMRHKKLQEILKNQQY